MTIQGISTKMLRISSFTLNGLTTSESAALLIAMFTPGVFCVVSWYVPSFMHLSVPVVIANCLLICCSLASGLSLIETARAARRSALIAGSVLVVSATAATALVASHPLDGALHLATTVIELALGFCLWGSFSSKWSHFRRIILIAFAIGILYEVAGGYALAIAARNVAGANWVNFPAGTTHVRQLGFYGIALSGLSAGLLATAEDRRPRFAYFVLAIIGFAWTDLSGGRAAFIAGLAGCMLVAALAPAERKRMSALYLLTAFFVALPLSLIYVPDPRWWGLPSILGRLSGFHSAMEFTTGRLFWWMGALKGFLASPLIGHGEGQYAYEVAGGQWNHPHNSILQFLYQWGLIGTTCVMIITTPIIASIGRAVSERPEVALPATGALTGLLLMSLLEGSLYHAFPVMIVVVCLAILASVSGKPGLP
jgi:O-antigen ligase